MEQLLIKFPNALVLGMRRAQRKMHRLFGPRNRRHRGRGKDLAVRPRPDGARGSFRPGSRSNRSAARFERQTLTLDKKFNHAYGGYHREQVAMKDLQSMLERYYEGHMVAKSECSLQDNIALAERRRGVYGAQANLVGAQMLYLTTEREVRKARQGPATYGPQTQRIEMITDSSRQNSSHSATPTVTHASFIVGTQSRKRKGSFTTDSARKS